MNEIKLGDKVRCKVSGFSGTVTAITNYLYSESYYGVTAPAPVDGGTKTEWFSHAGLEMNE